jgi:hypothetical protein
MMAVRRALPFLLTPFVVVLMLTASFNAFGPDTQPWTLAVGSVLVVIGILAIDLSVEARTGRKRLVAEVRAHPSWIRAAHLVATAATVVALALAKVHRQPLSGSWASLTLELSLGCYALALVLFAVAAYEHSRGWPLAVVIGFVTLVWPVAVIALLPHFDNHVFVVWALALALVPSPAIWLATRPGTSPRATAGSSAAAWACRCRFVQTRLLVASSLPLVAALRVPIERKFTQTTELGRRPNPRLAAPANMAAAIEAYSPVLRLDTGENWPERSIAHFLTAYPAATIGSWPEDPNIS